MLAATGLRPTTLKALARIGRIDTPQELLL